MGASLACEAVYRDAMSWFKKYIDKETYVAAFQSLDKDSDGGVDMQELQGWINQNASKFPETSWDLLESVGVVLMCSHKSTACHMDNPERSVKQRKIFDISDFRAFLLHLYAFQIFWQHYNSSDNKPARTMAKKKMNELEFAQACQSLASAHGCTFITVAKLKEDFSELDTNYSGSLGFIQVCNAACRFINTPPESDVPVAPKSELSVQKKTMMTKAMKILGVQLDENSANVMSVLSDQKPNKVFALTGLNPIQKMNLAVDQIKDRVCREELFIKRYQSDSWNEFKATFEDGADSDKFGDNVISAIHAEAAALRERNAAAAGAASAAT